MFKRKITPKMKLSDEVGLWRETVCSIWFRFNSRVRAAVGKQTNNCANCRSRAADASTVLSVSIMNSTLLSLISYTSRHVLVDNKLDVTSRACRQQVTRHVTCLSPISYTSRHGSSKQIYFRYRPSTSVTPIARRPNAISPAAEIRECHQVLLPPVNC